MAFCKWGICKWGILKHPVFNVLNFRGWIKLLYDKITLIYCVENEFNLTSEVQNIENRVFQNAPFANAPFANGSFPMVITVAYGQRFTFKRFEKSS